MQKEAMEGWDVAARTGAEQNRKEMQVEFVKSTILRFNNLSDAEVADFVKVPISLVKSIRKELRQENK